MLPGFFPLTGRGRYGLSTANGPHLVPKTCIGGSGTRTKDSPAGAVAAFLFLAAAVFLFPFARVKEGVGCFSLFRGRVQQCLPYKPIPDFRPRCGKPAVPAAEYQAWLLVSGVLCLLCMQHQPWPSEELISNFSRSFNLSVTLSMIGLLAGPLGWAGSPIGRPCQRLCRTGALPCHCLASCARPSLPILAWQVPAPRPRRRGHSGWRTFGLARFLFGLLGTLPVRVWAAPKQLSALLSDIDSAIAHLPEQLPPAGQFATQVVSPAGPSETGDQTDPTHPGSSGFWAGVVAEVQRDSLREAGLVDPRLPPSQRVLPVEPHVGRRSGEDKDRCNCDIYVASPYYAPALLQLCLLLPCEARDAEAQVKKHLGHDRFPYASAVVAVCPQPSQAFAAFVAYPEWAAQARLSTVLLDLRLAALQGRGPTISAYLPRPATAADVRKEAGLYSMGHCSIYIGSSPDPLRDDEQVHLYNGTLIRLVRPEFQPEEVRTLASILSDEDFQGFPGPFPRVPEPRALMLLHTSGRSFFSGQRAAGQAIHSAISDFVGVRPGTVTFHSPGDGHLERLSYRGATACAGHPSPRQLL